MENKNFKLTQEHIFIKNVLNKNIRLTHVLEDIVKIPEIHKIDDSYDFFLNITVRSFTNEKVIKLEKLISETITNIKNLQTMSEKQLWLNDILQLENELSK